MQGIVQAKRNKYKRQGSLSSVPAESILKYLVHLSSQTKAKSEASWAAELVGFAMLSQINNLKDTKTEWIPSVMRFSKLIKQEPVLRMNWQYGISQCQKTLPNKTGDDVLALINIATITPPAYSNHDLVGFPINAIFVQLMQNQNGRSFFSNKEVNLALKDILNDYNNMLNSQKSLKYLNQHEPDGWFCEEAKSKINYEQFICDPTKPHYGFKNWNQWFLRKFKPKARIIGAGRQSFNQNDIVNCCESQPLKYPSQPQRNVKKIDRFWLKDDVYSLVDMFGSNKYQKQYLADIFEGGTVYQAFLSALSYHCWHAPVSGTIIENYSIDGTYYFDQSQFIGYDEGTPNNSESFLSAVAARRVIVIQSDNIRIGKIAIIFIGMAEVSSCVSNVTIGQHVQKGEEIGHFEFGGSSHCIVFQPKVKLQFTQLYQGEGENLKVYNQKLSAFLATVIE